jgi:gliding motility-associated-like protein
MKNLYRFLLLQTLVFGLSFYVSAQNIFSVGTVTASCTSTGTLTFPIKVGQLTDVGSMQFTVEFDPTRFDFISNSNVTPGFASQGTITAIPSWDATTRIAMGQITFSWTRTADLTIIPDSTIFTVTLNYKGGGNAYVRVLKNGPSPMEVANGSNPNLPYTILPGGGVSVFDNVAPTITCPPNQAVTSSSPVAVPSLAASLSDNCGVTSSGYAASAPTNMTGSQANASSVLFAVGATTVTYLVTDAASNTATCSFTVTVTAPATPTVDTLTLIASPGLLNCNQSDFYMDILVNHFDSIGSLQYTFNWNPTHLRYDSVSMPLAALNLTTANYNTANAVSNGQFGFSWTTLNPSLPYLILPDGTRLIRLYFTVLSAATSNVAFQFTSVPVPIEAYQNGTASGYEVPVKWFAAPVQTSDLVAPILQCPPSVTVNLPQNQNSVQLLNMTATFSDDCDLTPTPKYEIFRNGTSIIAVNNSATANGTYNLGLTTVVFTVTDDSGNTNICFTDVLVTTPSAVVFYLDSVALDCNYNLPYVDVNVRVRNFADVAGAQFAIEWDETVLDFDTVTFVGVPLSGFAFDNFSTANQGILRYIDGQPAWPNIPDGGIFFTMRFNLPGGAINEPISFITPAGFAFEVLDGNADPLNAITVNGEVRSTDLVAPKITNCPTNLAAIAPGNSCAAVVNWPAIVVTDDCVGATTFDSNFVTNNFNTGDYTIQYIAKDQAGNADTCTFEIMVRDTVAPSFVVSCPADQTIQAGTQCTATATWVVPTYQDACDLVTSPATSSATPGATYPSGTTTVVYSATDFSGNTATCSFEINVIETVPPVITCPANFTVEIKGTACDTIVNWIPATATDNCPGFVSVSVSGNLIPGVSLPGGTSVIRYTAVDLSGNTATCSFVIAVKELVKPTIQCPPNVSVSVDNTMHGTCGGVATWALPQVNDNCAPAGAINVTSTHAPGSFFSLGNTFVTYAATDPSGNVATCNLVVNVSDKTAPVFSYCPPEQIFTLPPNECSVSVSWVEPVEADILEACGLDTLYSVQGFTSPHVFAVGNNAVLYFAIDASGNLAQCEFKVTVRDTVAPELGVCPSNVTVASNGCSLPYNYTLPPATDNCDNNVTVTSTPANGTVLAAGSTTEFKIRARDNYSNIDSCVFTVTVTGAASAAVTCPPNLAVVGCSSVANWTQPTTSGFCAPITTLVATPIDIGGTVPLGVNTITYTATDASGVVASCSFTVTITDPVPPTLACPANITIDVSGGIMSDAGDFINTATPDATCTSVVLTYNALTTTDNCGNVVNAQTSGPASGAAFAVGVTNMAYIATDATGNSANCTFTITVNGIAANVALQASTNPACIGDPLTIVAPNIPGATYQWTGPSGNFPNGSTVLINPVTAASAGTYALTITNNGCTFTSGAGLTISVPAAPDAMNDVYSFQVGQSDTLKILDNDLNTAGVSFDLINAPVGVTQIANGNLFFAGTTTTGTLTFQYEICADNCDDVCDLATVTIDIKDSPCIYEPNIITPNGDDLNDEWLIPCLEFDRYPNNSVVIYNQWGDAVFSASPYKPFPKSGAWNGSLNNDASKPCPDGVYYYIFKPSPTAAPRKGFIELFR